MKRVTKQGIDEKQLKLDEALAIFNTKPSEIREESIDRWCSLQSGTEICDLRWYVERETEEIANGVTHSGVVYHGDMGDSGCAYWVFNGELTDEEIVKCLVRLGVCEDTDRGVYDENDWDCSGKCLSYSPTIEKRTKTRVLVTQSFAYDV